MMITSDQLQPLSALADCIAETVDDITASGLLAPVFGHVGDGNFHCLLLVDPQAPGELALAEQLSERIVRRAIRHDGTCTGEHGVGLHKMRYLEEEHGEAAVRVMRRIKQALDPLDILNPGKAVRVETAPAAAD